MSEQINIEVAEIETISIDVYEYSPSLSVAGMTEKTSIHNDDLIMIEDSEDAFAKKRIKASRITDGGTFT